MTNKESLEYIKNHGVWQFAAIHGLTTPDEKLIEAFSTVEKYLEEYEIAKNLIHELGNILYGDDEECKTDCDMIRRCQWKILQYLEDKAKRLRTEKLVKEELENDK